MKRLFGRVVKGARFKPWLIQHGFESHSNHFSFPHILFNIHLTFTFSFSHFSLFFHFSINQLCQLSITFDRNSNNHIFFNIRLYNLECNSDQIHMKFNVVHFIESSLSLVEPKASESYQKFEWEQRSHGFTEQDCRLPKSYPNCV